ncbi:MAG: ABC-type transport system, involved in lipoprotein release, permease component, partial [Acidimicrobiales bacterium]|nr:ABC-type transport system, involved in lipoprotein release, permease component [Acidimicrobiales bacterium]
MWWLAGGALRRRWVGVVVAAAVAALLFGGAASALVGARRSSTAVDRFLAFGPPEDLYVSAPDGVRLDMAAVARLPQVLAAAHQSYLALVPIGPDGRPQLDRVGSINPYLYAPVVGPPDAIARRRILRGRDLDPTKSLEVVIDEELAADRHLGVGGRLLMAAYRGDQMAVALSSGAVIPPPKGPRLALDVVGIARTPSDIHPGEDAHTTSFGGTKDIYLTPALFRRYGARLAVYDPPVPGSPVAIRLVHGAADAAGFTAAVRRLPGGSQALIETGGSDALDSARTARRAIAVETGALVVLAALLAASGTVLVGQASSRLARSLTGDLATLRALGLRPIELLAVAAAPALGAVGLAVVGGVGVALVTSPLTPIGLAHQADVTPGFHVDPAILATGAAVTLAVGGVLAVLTARGAVRSILAPSGGAARSRPGVATRLARWRAPLAPTMGARFATEPRTGERAAPVRSAVVTTTIGLAALVGVGTYAASLEQLAARPGAQGANWDVTIGNPNLSAYRPADVRRLDADPRVAAVAAVASPQGRATVDGLDVTLAGVDGATAEVGPLPIRGRLPNARGEIALGRRTARRLRVQIGDRVTAAMNGRSQRLTVVGTALLNPGLAPTMQLGDGALTSIALVRALLPDQPITFLLARLAPG